MQKLVVTSAPITADAATTKVLGVKKTFTVAGTKVTGLSKTEKKVVKVTIKNKKVTVKGLKAGKVSFKIGKETYNVNVGATKVTATAAATTLKVNDKTTVAIKATNGAKDKLTIKTSKSSVVKIGKSSVTADKNGKASVTLRGLAAGTSTITVKSANTGMYAKVKITVKADETATAAPASDAPATLAPATDAPVGPTVVPTSGGAVTTAPTSGGAVTAAPTSGGAVTAAPTATPAVPVVSASAISGSAVGAKKIQVKFNQPVTTGSAVIAVKVGTIDKAITSKAWTDNQTVVLTMNENLLDATYSISANEVGGTVLTTDVVAKAEKASYLKFDETKVAFSSNSGNLAVSVCNQYDEKMTIANNSIVATAYNKTQEIADTITTSYAYATGLKLDSATTKVGDKLLITLSYGDLPVISGEVEVVLGKTAADVKLGVYEKTTNTTEVHLENGDTFKLPIKIVDQYSAEMAFVDTQRAWAGEADLTGEADSPVTSGLKMIFLQL